jgi:Zn-dependent peptidase ImmA (M78 family)
MAMRIPRTVRLPFGFTVAVRQVTRAEMRDVAECADGDEEPDGLWAGDEMTIYLVRSLPITRRRYILCHELQHAAADLTHEQLNDGVGKP